MKSIYERLDEILPIISEPNFRENKGEVIMDDLLLFIKVFVLCFSEYITLHCNEFLYLINCLRYGCCKCKSNEGQ